MSEESKTSKDAQSGKKNVYKKVTLSMPRSLPPIENGPKNLTVDTKIVHTEEQMRRFIGSPPPPSSKLKNASLSELTAPPPHLAMLIGTWHKGSAIDPNVLLLNYDSVFSYDPSKRPSAPNLGSISYTIYEPRRGNGSDESVPPKITLQAARGDYPTPRAVSPVSFAMSKRSRTTADRIMAPGYRPTRPPDKLLTPLRDTKIQPENNDQGATSEDQPDESPDEKL